MTDIEIVKEMQEIRGSIKRHIDLTNEMGQDLLRIGEEHTGGSKIWLTTDYFKKVVKHFCHSNYLVKCLELVFEYINRQNAEIKEWKRVVETWVEQHEKDKAEIERLLNENHSLAIVQEGFKEVYKIAKSEAYKEFAELSIKRICEEVSAPIPSESYIVEKCNQTIDNLLKELVGDNNDR